MVSYALDRVDSEVEFRTLRTWNEKRNSIELDVNNTQPQWSYIFSVTMALIATSILSFCFAIRTYQVRSYRDLPLARWLILAIYADSWIFVVSSTILSSGVGLSTSGRSCGATILVCLVCYILSKIFIYLFLIERVYIVHGRLRPRLQDKLYLFNTCCMLVPFCGIIALGFVYRIAVRDKNKVCRVGIELPANLSLLIFDVIVNVYLTVLFLTPILNLYAFKNPSSNQNKLRRIAHRSLIGAVVILLTSFANLTALLIMRGKEPGWICFLTCNADIIMSALILHWVTRRDSSGRSDDSSVPLGPRLPSPSDIQFPLPYFTKKTQGNTTDVNSTEHAGGIFVGMGNNEGVVSSCTADNPICKKSEKKAAPVEDQNVPNGPICITTKTETVQEFEPVAMMSGTTAMGEENDIEGDIGMTNMARTSRSLESFRTGEGSRRSIRNCGSAVEMARYAYEHNGWSGSLEHVRRDSNV